jgi:ABC-type glutathione transport system ATPase component
MERGEINGQAGWTMSGFPLLRAAFDAGYPGRPVLHDIRFELKRGEVLGLVGTSGAGKSTLVLSLLGLLPWRGGRVNGEVLLDGKNLLRMPEREMRILRGRTVSLIPQSPMTALNSAISLRTHFYEAWKAHERNGRTDWNQRVMELLSDVQLPADPDFLRRRPTEISVGQAQRVLIALALLHRPSLLIADEPTSALDPVTQTQVVDLLKSLSRKHATALLYVSHDLVSVLRLSDRIAVLDHGKIVEEFEVSQAANAKHAATLSLIGTLPAPLEVLLRYRDSGPPAAS